MSRFFEDAMRVFETARAGADDGTNPDLGILIDQTGALRIVAAAGWRTEALQEYYGARTVFHVSRTGSNVRVVGRSPERSCVLQTEGPARPYASLDNPLPQYTVLPLTN